MLGGSIAVCNGGKNKKKNISPGMERRVCLKINYTVNMTRVSNDALRGAKEICSCLHIGKSALPTNELLILCLGVREERREKNWALFMVLCVLLMYTSYGSHGTALLIDGVE